MVSWLVRRPEIFCWVFSGRTPRSLMLFVGQIVVSRVNRRTSSWRSRQNSSRSRPGCWAVECFGPGMRGMRQAGQDGVAELADQRAGGGGGDLGPAVVAGMRARR